MVDKYSSIITSLPEWIVAYVQGVGKVDDIAQVIEEIPSKASEVAKNAPSEFSELEFMEKSRMIK